ncbi:isoaspartyl peptidase/L-asparaginase family protein [Asticcacaulis excentricus]|uniref:Isoaspartyl peptidase n=1 Tax=Asticcacaulis excentricus (strain ATCC 15261 / DSM 4724 / KCTC 12464 / NCIMB 9791 / VKM B-1370 / CB 48) TaxID=573065 RepID=E8RLB1_ASTEC|nr:isoaspartyl peptidase/L-asparaginase [Asticcacaulis excentricus]ADU12601.1 peptidase T2 asparaginase 2 [Asticcacaulis excentricus CB 48]
MIAFALHGGAGAKAGRDYGREITHMKGLAKIARHNLHNGARALDVVTETVRSLEDSGLYVAGKGASPNAAGVFELDASLMSGADRRAGAVAALAGYKNPVVIARAVMEKTPHVLLAGDGARQFAEAQGFETVSDDYFTRAGAFESNYPPGTLAHGTVGCVCLDSYGDLASATSTAGVFGKLPGRVGDTPIIGAGTWADDHAAISCTGQGEYFLRVQAAAQVAFRIGAGQGAFESAGQVLEQIVRMGGEGGLIVITRAGEVHAPFRSAGMKRAYFSDNGDIVSEAF